MRPTKKIASAVVAGVLGLAVTGTAAFAAFQPSEPAPVTGALETGSTTGQAHPAAARDRVKDVLDKLVANGTITQAQEDAILQAFKDAAGNRDKDGRKVLATVLKDLMRASADYIGLPPGQLRHQLAGKSLAQVAEANGKTRDGLIAALTADVNAKIDQLVDANKLTADQAAKMKAKMPDRIAKFVDRVFKTPGTAPKASPTT